MTLHLTPEELKTRHQAQQKAWRENHPDSVRGYHRKYAAKPEVKDRKREFDRTNREHINTRRRELYRLRHTIPGPPDSEGNDTAPEGNINSSDQPICSTDE